MDEFLINTLYSFLLIIVRFSGLFLIAPIFSGQIIPKQVKMGLTFVVSIILYPVIFTQELIPFPVLPLQLVFEVTNELLIGLILGFAAYMVYTVFQISGKFIDFRMGFTMVSVIDPMVGDSVPLTGQFKTILAILIMLITNGHHLMLQGLLKSFELLPIGHPIWKEELAEFFFKLGGEIFLIGFRLALPIIATLFLVEFIFGLLARTVPQMNVFMLGFPIKILIGFLVLYMSIPYLVHMTVEILGIMNTRLFQVIKVLQ